MRTAEIGRVVDTVAKWDPRRDGSGTLTYVDLSSVDQSTKAVAEPTTVEATKAPSRARQLVATGDVLVSTVRPNLNAVAYVQPDLDGATASTGFCVLRPRRDELDGRYLYHWARSAPFIGHLVQLATGASYPAVSDKIVKAAPIPLPPLDEQRRIAAILDAADALRAKRRQALTQLGCLKSSVVSNQVGELGNSEPLGDHLEFVTSGSRGWAKYYSDSGSRFIRSQDVHLGMIDDGAAAYVTPPENSESRRTRIRAGDLLVTITGIVGKVAAAPPSLDGAFISQHVSIARLADSLRPGFAEAYMCSHEGQRQLERLQYGQTKPGLNLTQIREFLLPVPSLRHQDALLEKLEKVAVCLTSCQKATAKLDTLFASLQQRAFRGEL